MEDVEKLLERKVVGKITACQKIVKEVIAEWEKAETVRDEWWRALGIKYDLDVEKYTYSISNTTGEITQTNKDGYVGEWIRKHEDRIGFRERMRRIFKI